MSTVLSPVLVQRFCDSLGNPLFNGQLFSYEAGTTTPLATYTDSTGLTPNPNPTILNARGEASVWLPPNTAYKFVLEDSFGNTIWTVDNVLSQEATLYGGTGVGIANAYVLTFDANFTSLADGIVIYWLPDATNTGPSTVNVNGLGVVNVVNPDGSALLAGQIFANIPATILYLGGKWLLTSSVVSTGSWTTTLSGPWVAGNNPSGALKYERQGSQVTIYSDVLISATVTTGSWINGTGIPAIIRPSSTRRVLADLAIGGVDSLGTFEVATDGTFKLFAALSTTGLAEPIGLVSNFPTGGGAGIGATFSVTYSL